MDDARLATEAEDRPDDLRPYRVLALSVLAGAAADARHAADPLVKHEARLWLEGERDRPALAFWCTLADLPVESVTATARRRWASS